MEYRSLKLLFGSAIKRIGQRQVGFAAVDALDECERIGVRDGGLLLNILVNWRSHLKGIRFQGLSKI